MIFFWARPQASYLGPVFPTRHAASVSPAASSSFAVIARSSATSRQLPVGAPTMRSVNPASHPFPFAAAGAAFESLDDCALLPALAASC